MGKNRQAILAIALVAVFVLAGCSGSGYQFWDDQRATASTSPSDPCAPPPCDPCAPPPCDPCAPAPVACDPCGPQPSGARPPNARPGEVWCYVRVPAVTRTVEEQVCIQPETCRQEWVPPVMKTVNEQICVKPEEVRRIPIPAVYETQCEQIMTCAGKTEWRRVSCEPSSLGEGEQLGECWSLVEIPPVYETRSKQICVSPESCREEIIPACYENRCKEVECQPGYYKNIPVPAVYETRCREELVCAARWEWRRTTECEVPGAPGGYDAGMAPVAVPDTYGMPAPNAAAGSGSPDDMIPTGELPPVDPFAPQAR